MNDEIFFIEKLSVNPDYRHNGYGKELMEFAHNYIEKNNGQIISIGIIDENKILKEWYKTLGYCEIGTKKYEHLPFTVCFLEKNLN